MFYNPYGMFGGMGNPYMPAGNPFYSMPAPQMAGPYGRAMQPQAIGSGQLCTPPQMSKPQQGMQYRSNIKAKGADAAGRKPVSHSIQKAKKDKTDHLLKVTDFTANDLTEEILDEIVGKYGIGIDDIYHLAPGQEWMFSQAKNVTSAFFTQALFKAVIKIKPSTFRQKIDSVCKKRDNLRTAFAYENMPKPYQVVLKNRTADLKFLDISNVSSEELDDTIKSLMAADRRRGFDLENDPLLRVTIYKTCEEDTYAILISQPHINNDGASTGILMKELFLDYAMESQGIPTEELENISFQKYAQWLEDLDRTKEFDYWKEVLADMPALTVAPGYAASNLEFDMQTKGLRFDSETNKKIRKMQGTYKATINNIMQTAWGVMLQKLYGVSDVTFGAITSGRSAEVQNSDMITGGMVNAVPVRIRTNGDVTFAELVRDTQKQFAQSLQYSHCAPSELQSAIGRKEPIFDHLLNFHNFVGAGEFSDAPKLPGITLLDSESFDNLSTDLCVYFMMQKGAFVCNFTYNGNTFTDSKIDILIKCFQKVVEQIVQNDTELKVSQIECPDMSVFAAAEREDAAKKQKIRSFLAGLSVFQGVDAAAIRELADQVKITSYVSDDVIFAEKKELKELSFVMEGYVELAREAMNGWTNSLMSLKPGKMLSAAGVLDGTPTYVTARAISKDVKVLSIPKEVVWKFLERYPVIALNMIQELEAVGKSYSFLWLGSDC